jgi:hypothetical protein
MKARDVKREVVRIVACANRQKLRGWQRLFAVLEPLVTKALGPSEPPPPWE